MGQVDQGEGHIEKQKEKEARRVVSTDRPPSSLTGGQRTPQLRVTLYPGSNSLHHRTTEYHALVTSVSLGVNSTRREPNAVVDDRIRVRTRGSRGEPVTRRDQSFRRVDANDDLRLKRGGTVSKEEWSREGRKSISEG